jgi:predicted DNA-binding protein
MEDQQNFNSSISTRCSDQLRESLEKLATADKRPLANYIRIVLEDHIREAEEKSAKKRNKAA